MSSRIPRRRKADDDPEDATEADDTVHLDDTDHAWWAQRPVEDLWRPRQEAARPPAEERDVLADHFGADWRTSFGFDPPPPSVGTEPPGDEEPDEPDPGDAADAYGVLGVAPEATWDEIVDAHRRMARRHHPDRLVGRPSEEIATGEDRIRRINAAYAELRIRRGR